jgi:hypothetical protein
MPRVHRSHVAFEPLDDRLVPSATVLDLTARGAEATAAGAVVQQVDAQPTGTGYIHSFVRVQGAASGGGVEQGYNTDARPLQFDENKSPQFTRSLTLGQVPVVNHNGGLYREFLLDVNQKSSAPYLSLDEVRVFLGAQPNLTGYSTSAKTLAGQAAVFDLDAGGDVSVKLNYRLNAGSGSGDMLLLVPASAFDGADAGSYVYLYSKMGCLSGASANSGFEEWAVRTQPASQPAPATGSLSGFVYLDPNQDLSDGVAGGIAGVFIHLQGVSASGLNVDLVTQTDANGAYSFTGLEAGLYTITEDQPGGLVDGADYIGTINGVEVGTADNDRFFDIQLTSGASGINYNFTEYFVE